jgi:hypothetical protein
MTYDGITDKTQGKTFVVTPASWNGLTPSGTVRTVNFQLIHDEDEPEVKLLSMAVNGEKEVRYQPHISKSNT